MNHNFRNEARSALQRAEVELASANDARLPYAALELRMCIEALTYDRAQMFEKDLPLSEWDVWQPKRVMEMLIEMEPHVNQGGSVFFRPMSKPNEVPEPWLGLGTETVFTLAKIKSSYNALGNYLHYPTQKQLRNNTLDQAGRRQKCQEIYGELAEALASPIFNIDLPLPHMSAVCGSCRSTIRKHYRVGDPKTEARCLNPACGEVYELSTVDGKARLRLHGQDIFCRVEGCAEVHFVPNSQRKDGHHWFCAGCGAEYALRLLLHHMSAPNATVSVLSDQSEPPVQV